MEKGIKAIKCGKLIDGTGREPVDNATIVIKDSKINAVGKDIPIPKNADVIDAMDRTVMPGLIESHMHHMGLKTESYYIEGIIRNRECTLIQAVFNSKDLLAAGFTTAKDCGGWNGIALKLASEEGTLTGVPRIIAAGPSLNQTFGHADTHFLPLECNDIRTTNHLGLLGKNLICDGAEECIKATRYAMRSGADFIKVCTTGGVLSQKDKPTDVNFNIDEIKAITETAAQMGRYVTAHCQNSLGAKNSVLGGIKTIDHANEINNEVIELAEEKGALFVSSLAIVNMIKIHGKDAGMPLWGIEKAKEQWDIMCETYERLRKSGAVLAVGTDYCGSPLLKLGDNAIELELLVKNCGFTPMEAIVAATKYGAMACFVEEKTGTIEPGKCADIIVIDGDPLADITVLQKEGKIKQVMLEGKVEIDREE